MRRAREATRGMWRFSAPIRGALVAGAAAGFISAGIGSRIVMAIIALLNEDQERVLTDASATVGEFSIGGTASLLALGTIAGVLGGLLYLGLRRWLWVPPAWRGLAFGALTLVTVGQPLFDTHNVDSQMFEPVLVVIGLFTVLFFINGLILAPLFDRIHPEPAYPPGERVPRVVVAAIGLVTLLGLAVMAGTVQTMIDDEGTCYAAVGVAKAAPFSKVKACSSSRVWAPEPGRLRRDIRRG